jgi:hypothetical protein
MNDRIELLEKLLYCINNNNASFQCEMNDDLIKLKRDWKNIILKGDDGQYYIYVDESIKNQVKYDLREEKLNKLLND